ncbi:sodium:solute symporter family protein [Anaerocolumna sp. MB42-C2]|uniref:sodium:solute symporter family protein n=1 Tax=Anaerocolumna sp. MB42-C2 TaxID=3070997 RepID=UPI0027E0ED86|nr:sodium:solute symporter family protein [Anaerocolumna sp. MB42-C2]WMJ89574.1 sodium:solute symporter family protein [Anaerocolumna sp. MB42-C2]
MEYIICLAVYLAIMIGVSIYSKARTKNVDDYALGGRSIPSWMSAFSYGTAYFSAVILIGHAGKNGWTFGLGAFWIVIGNSLLGTYLAWKVLGTRTREMTQRLGAATMPQFLGIRYKDPKLKIISSLIIFIFLVPYAASVYKGLGYLFQITFNMNERVIMLIMTIITALYLFAGGFLAASIADFIQGIIMIIGVCLLIYFILAAPEVNGITHGIEGLNSINPDLIKPLTKGTVLPIISLVIMTSLGTWGLPQMVSKFYTIKSEKSIPAAKIVSTIFAVIITTGAYTMGTMSRLILKNDESLFTVNGKLVYDKIVPMVINHTLPKIVIGILLVVILAASMSTLASIVLASSTTFVMDLIKPITGDKLDDKKTVTLLRICCILFVVAAYFLATGNSPILSLNSLSWGVVSGCMLAPYLLGLYWKNATKTGVYASIISAILIMTGGVLKYSINSPMITTISACSMIIPIPVLYVVSLVTRLYEQAHIEYIFNKSENMEADL